MVFVAPVGNRGGQVVRRQKYKSRPNEFDRATHISLGHTYLGATVKRQLGSVKLSVVMHITRNGQTSCRSACSSIFFANQANGR